MFSVEAFLEGSLFEGLGSRISGFQAFGGEHTARTTYNMQHLSCGGTHGSGFRVPDAVFRLGSHGTP